MSKRLIAILNVQQSELQSMDNSIEVDSKQDKLDLDKLVQLMKEKLSYHIREKK